MEEYTHYVIKTVDSNDHNPLISCEIRRIERHRNIQKADFFGTWRQCLMWSEEELNIRLPDRKEQDYFLVSIKEQMFY